MQTGLLFSEERSVKIFSNSHLAVRGKIDIEGHGERDIVDISSLGVMVHDPARVPVGTNLQFNLVCEELQSDPMRMSGVLFQHLEVEGLGVSAIEFTRPNPAHKRALEEFIQTQKRRRSLPRVAIQGVARVRGQETFDIVDISETGILMETRRVVPPGSVLHFQLESPLLPAPSLALAGVSVRSFAVGGTAHTAVELIRVNPAHRDVLKALVTEAMRQGWPVR